MPLHGSVLDSPADQVYTVYIDVRLLMICLTCVKCLPGGSAVVRCVYPYFSTASPIFRCRFCLSRRMRSEKILSSSGLFTYRRLFGISGMSFFKASNQPGRKLVLSEDRLDPRGGCSISSPRDFLPCRPDRVQDNVRHTSRKMALLLDVNGFIPALQEVAGPVVLFIERPGVDAA